VNWPLRRKLLSRFANTYVRTVTRLVVRDCTSGYRCWRRDALATFPLDHLTSDGYAFLVEMLYVAARNGCHIAEVPITFVERRLGEFQTVARHTDGVGDRAVAHHCQRPLTSCYGFRDFYMPASPPEKPASLSIFFPAYNDGGTIASMVIRAVKAAAELTPDFEVIVVDDGSADGTADIVDELARTYPQVRAVHHPINRDYGAALQTGFRSATKDLIFYTDGDAQYDPAELAALWPAWGPGPTSSTATKSAAPIRFTES